MFMVWQMFRPSYGLTADETNDLWILAQKVGKQLESYHKASSLTFAIQVSLLYKSNYLFHSCFMLVDGPCSGQTVPHVHIHIVPRKGEGFENNDEIHDTINEKEKERKKRHDLDKQRTDRSMDEMAQEAAEYRKLFV
ncbi:bifunctional bis(5'-adenosyl)-triphosphatase/adenylylsulfatase FHIT-like isoform X1 [Bidens hawaiensis]|uniref:bifunctional bis(5'-adenosyl)-triphosphatase/adenylylsulfatase FHIT-like isoform X1 n=1 Tax=Bidens hawaiensis TaxID=980011 RepID=UPI00404A2C73